MALGLFPRCAAGSVALNDIVDPAADEAAAREAATRFVRGGHFDRFAIERSLRNGRIGLLANSGDRRKTRICMTLSSTGKWRWIPSS